MEAPILIPPDDAPVFNPNLGGVIESPAAFALLTGRYEDLKTSSFTKIHIPITTLPAVLGRTHPSSDSNVSAREVDSLLARLASPNTML